MWIVISQKLQKSIGVDMINKKGGNVIEKCVSLWMNILLFQMLSNTFPWEDHWSLSLIHDMAWELKIKFANKNRM